MSLEIMASLDSLFEFGMTDTKQLITRTERTILARDVTIG